MARKNGYTEDQIMEWLTEWSSQTVPVSSFFSGSANRISFAELYRRIRENETLRQHYARAIEDRAERYNADIDEVVNDVRSGLLDPASARIVLDARKWQASKMAPRDYGDKIQTEHSGGVTTTVINLGSGVRPEGANSGNEATD